MADTRLVFCGFGAVVGSVMGSSIGFWMEFNITDPNKLTYVDLMKSTNQMHSNFKGVEVDAAEDESATRLYVLANGQVGGRIYLEQSIVRLKNLPVPPPGCTGRPYEYQVVYIHKGVKSKRFYGFHARITGTSGTLPVVGIFKGGKSMEPGEQFTFQGPLDLSTGDFDPMIANGGMTEIGPGTGDAKEGSLFIERSIAQKLNLMIVKLPPSLNDEPIP